MAILAAIGSFSTPITVDLILGSGDMAAAGGGSLNTAQLVRSIVLLQIVPFLVGLSMRAWVPAHADQWAPAVKKIANVTFGLVMFGIIAGGFQQVIELVGSWLILSAVVAGLFWFGIGALLAPAPTFLRTTAGFLAASRNAGPVLLIATASFADFEGMIPAIITVYIAQLVTQLALASWLGKRNTVNTGQAA